MSASFAGTFVPGIRTDTDQAATQASLARSISDIQRAAAGGVEYQADKESEARRDGRQYRVAVVKCSFCACHTRIHQSRANDSEPWNPEELSRLAVFGWVAEGTRAFCGDTCRRRYRLRERDHNNDPLPVAERVSGPTPARNLYAAKTVVTPPTQGELARMAEESRDATDAETTPRRGRPGHRPAG